MMTRVSYRMLHAYWKKSQKKIAVKTNRQFAVWDLRLVGKGEGYYTCNKSRNLSLVRQSDEDKVFFEWDGDSQMEHCVQFWVPHFLSNASADDVDFFLSVA